MAQEQPANQHQQQQHFQHLRSNRYNTIAHSTSIPADPQVPTLKRDNGHSNNITMDDVFVPRGDTADASNEEMDKFNREELEDFKRFCFMAKPLENRPKVALKVTLMHGCHSARPSRTSGRKITLTLQLYRYCFFFIPL